MSADPRILYIILVLPGLFGITLIAEGIHKLLQDEWYGLINIIFGLGFLALVGIVYYFFNLHLEA